MEGNGNGDWKPRTFRKLPEGTKVRRIREDVKTHVEHGEKTWTTGQSVRDILQNHLDANTQRFFDHLVSAVIDTDTLRTRPQTEKLKDKFDDFTYTLFRLRKGMGNFSPETERELMQKLASFPLFEPPLKKDLLDENFRVDLTKFKQAIEPIREEPPKITYRVVDAARPGSEQLMTVEELRLHQEKEGEEFRYQIMGVAIEDEGSGFDSKLTAFYKSTKVGKRHLRGRFGEGAKMSEVHLLRHGAEVKMRSRFIVNGEVTRHERRWQATPFIDTDQNMKQRGVEIALPPGYESDTQGSATFIDIDKANLAFQREFRMNVDPRVPGGLAANCLEYSPHTYYYPMGVLQSEEQAVGVSTGADPKAQYVQGLRIGEEGSDLTEGRTLFSYDFLDKSLIQGRDRNRLRNGLEQQVRQFWYKADSPVLVRELILRTLLQPVRPGSSIPYETQALRDLVEHTPEYAPPQQRRMFTMVMEDMPAMLGLEPGQKNVIVSRTNMSLTDDRDLMNALSRKGYRIVRIPGVIFDSTIKGLREYHKGKLSVHTLTEMRGEISSIMGEVDATDERTQNARKLYTDARAELDGILQKIEGPGVFNLDTEPMFIETLDASMEQPVQVTFDQATGKFKIQIRPELIDTNASFGAEYWKLRMQIEMLATYNRTEAFPDRNTALMHSQDNANTLLIKTLHPGVPDLDAVPDSFNHTFTGLTDNELLRQFFEHMTKVEENKRGWNAFRQLKDFSASFETMTAIGKSFHELPEYYRRGLGTFFRDRRIIEDGKIKYFTTEYTPEGEKKVGMEVPLADLQPVATIQGRAVYEVNGYLVSPFDIPPNAVVGLNEDERIVFYKGKVLTFGSRTFNEHQYDTYPLAIDRGSISMYMKQEVKDINEHVALFEKLLGAVSVRTPESLSPPPESMQAGRIPLPIPVEYGKDEWDNPARVFEDIVQNHIDAAPDGKVKLGYEVTRAGERFWVMDTELQPEDAIVGFIVMDNGNGYYPHDIGTLGKSSKKSPMFAGKYGEGQKMLAAAATRNELELSFSSRPNPTSNADRWTAYANTQEEELFEGGQATKTHRVVFDVSIDPAEAEPVFTSASILRLPTEPTSRAVEQWSQWAQVIDPRVKDERGNGGLSRYVINLREGNNPNVIDMGYMKILLDEPGAIYENGLLIAKDPTKTAVGYDVPEVSETRERNAFKKEMLEAYIANAIKNCEDPRYAEQLLHKLNEKYIPQMVNDQAAKTHIPELDLDIGRTLSYKRLFVASKPLWQNAYATQIGNYVVYSQEQVDEAINFAQKAIEQGRGFRDDFERFNKARATLAGMRHIPSDQVLHVSKYAYNGWEQIFPTAESYVATMSAQDLPVTEEVLGKLQHLIAASGKTIADLATQMRADPATSASFDAIVSKSESQLVRNAIQSAVQRELDFWSDEDKIKAKPDTVFVTPDQVSSLGLAMKGRVGVSERLLGLRDPQELVAVGRHELIHNIFDKNDYTPEFIMLLLLSAKQNLATAA